MRSNEHVIRGSRIEISDSMVYSKLLTATGARPAYAVPAAGRIAA